MARTILDFEKPIAEIDARIEEIRRFAEEHHLDKSAEIAQLVARRSRLLREIFSRLTPWDKVQLARHEGRPETLDYIHLMIDHFLELHGDRHYAEDPALVGGMGYLEDIPVMLVGHQKGKDAKERALRNFGSARPEGYRKALRLMRLAEKFHRPILSFVDTPAADCSVEAEERGISEAIARNMFEMIHLETPILVVILGQGGSGGAVGIGVGDRVLMLEYAIYSVIPPEGCAAIIWRDPNKGPEAAAALKLTAEDALRLGIIDEIVPEPLGGAHREPEAMVRTLKETLLRHLRELLQIPIPELLEQRYHRFRKIGVYLEEVVSVGDR